MVESEEVVQGVGVALGRLQRVDELELAVDEGLAAATEVDEHVADRTAQGHLLDRGAERHVLHGVEGLGELADLVAGAHRDGGQGEVGVRTAEHLGRVHRVDELRQVDLGRVDGGPRELTDRADERAGDEDGQAESDDEGGERAGEVVPGGGLRARRLGGGGLHDARGRLVLDGREGRGALGGELRVVGRRTGEGRVGAGGRGRRLDVDGRAHLGLLREVGHRRGPRGQRVVAEPVELVGDLLLTSAKGAELLDGQRTGGETRHQEVTLDGVALASDADLGGGLRGTGQRGVVELGDVPELVDEVEQVPDDRAVVLHDVVGVHGAGVELPAGLLHHEQVVVGHPEVVAQLAGELAGRLDRGVVPHDGLVELGPGTGEGVGRDRVLRHQQLHGQRPFVGQSLGHGPHLVGQRRQAPHLVGLLTVVEPGAQARAGQHHERDDGSDDDGDQLRSDTHPAQHVSPPTRPGATGREPGSEGLDRPVPANH